MTAVFLSITAKTSKDMSTTVSAGSTGSNKAVKAISINQTALAAAVAVIASLATVIAVALDCNPVMCVAPFFAIGAIQFIDKKKGVAK